MSNGEQSGLLTLTATESVFIVHADEKANAFVELEAAIRSIGGTVRDTSY